MKRLVAALLLTVFSLLFTTQTFAFAKEDAGPKTELVKKAFELNYLVVEEFCVTIPDFCNSPFYLDATTIVYSEEITARANGPPNVKINPNALVRRLSFT